MAINYGAKYEETKGLATSEVAGLLRADIQRLIETGEFPGLKVRVRTRCGALSSAIDMQIVGFDGPIYNRAHHDLVVGNWKSKIATALTDKLFALSATYNFDDPASTSNVRFYAHVEWGEKLTAADYRRRRSEWAETKCRSQDQAAMRHAASLCDKIAGEAVTEKALLILSLMPSSEHSSPICYVLKPRHFFRDPMDPSLVAG